MEDWFGWGKRDKRVASYRAQLDDNRRRAKALLANYRGEAPAEGEPELCLNCRVRLPRLFCSEVWRCAFCFEITAPPTQWQRASTAAQ